MIPGLAICALTRKEALTLMATATAPLHTAKLSRRVHRPFAERSPRFLLLLVVGVALLIRMVVVSFLFRGVADPAHHHSEFGEEVGWIARSLATHQGFSSPFFPSTGSTAIIPPLYPFLLSAIFRVFGLYSVASAFVILSLNSLFSALTCIPIYFATRSTLGPRAALYAGWAWAFYPFAVYFSAGRVWEYSLTSLLLTTCFCLALRLHRNDRPATWLGFGLLFGITVLSNPAVLSLFIVFTLIALWKLNRKGGRYLRAGLLAALGMVAVLTPWTIRNYRALHVICPVRDSLGYEFWSGNNGDTSNPTLEWSHPASNPEELQLYTSQGEIAYIAQKNVLGKEWVRHHKADFTRLTIRRFIYYWTGFWSLDPVYTKAEPFQFPNTFFCSSLTILLLLGARRLWNTNREAALCYMVPIVLFPLAYYVTHPLMDYRQPIEPEIIVVVVMGVSALRAWWRSRATAYVTPAAQSAVSVISVPEIASLT